MSRSPHRRRSRSDDVDARRALEQAFEEHGHAIGAYALRRASAADAADVVADTFLVAWRRRDDMPPEPDTLPWLYGVARRVLANQRRSRARRTRLHDRLATEFAELATIDRGVAHDELAAVAAALERLPRRDAELLRLAAWEGLTAPEIATVMDLSPDSVRQRLHRARRRLRDQIGEHDIAAITPHAPRPPTRTGTGLGHATVRPSVSSWSPEGSA